MMTIADSLSPCLPQYHPLVLSELTNGGHLDAVKLVLINLAVAINKQFEMPEGCVQMEPMQLEKYDLVAGDSAKDDDSRCLAPVLLHDILDENGRINNNLYRNTRKTPETSKLKTAAKQPTKASYVEAPKDAYVDLFSSNAIEDEVLHNYLAHNLLPGLNSLDQMELLAIADTVANDVHSDKVIEKSTNGGIASDDQGRGYASSGNKSTESMDQCGVRFVFAMHNHVCLLRALPVAQRSKLLQQGLASCHFAWAFHSEAEEEMLSLISSVQRGAPEWQELKTFGAGWWVRSNVTLRRLIEHTARAAFQKNNSPLEAAVFFMALNKKNVLKGLFRSVREDRMMQFFSQDFSEDRWHRAALKNAFALMGKQRFQEAAAFFLLGNAVEDAVEVCIEKLKDLQLAYVIVRLYDQDKSTSNHREFLKRHVIGDTEKGSGMRRDPFLRSMAYWQLGQYEDALKTLLANEEINARNDEDSKVNITDIYNFYNFLRTHPLIMRQKKIEQLQSFTGTDQDYDDRISMEERILFFATAATHLEAGCPLLTLDVLSSLPPLKDDTVHDQKCKSKVEVIEEQPLLTSDSVGTQRIETAADADWSTPSFDTGLKDELDLDWSESEPESDDSSIGKDDRPQIPTPLKKVNVDEVKATQQTDDSTEVPKTQRKLYSDVFAHQLRLMACSKIFVSELKAIAASNNGEGAQIRDRLYSWLEKETKVLQRISPYSQERVLSPQSVLPAESDKAEKSDFSSDTESETEDAIKTPNQKNDESSFTPGASIPLVPSLHELYLAEKKEWKTRRENHYNRRRWLRQHRRFLRCLFSYCGLHDDSQGSLSPLRMELLFLLQDSLQEKSPHQLSSPIPNLTTIPLLTSSVVTCRTVVAEPLAQLTYLAHDILQTTLLYSNPPPYPLKAGAQSPTITICRQAEALAACVYQSLCDITSKSYRARLLDKSAPDVSGLTPRGSTSRPAASSQYMPPTTLPSQWPGVVSLHTLLHSESSEHRPRLIVLLCESLVAVYVSLLLHGLQTCNSLLLYRLVSNSLCKKTWNAVFGGGARIPIKYIRPAGDGPRVAVRIEKPCETLLHGLSGLAGMLAQKNVKGSPSQGMLGHKMRERLNRKALSYSHERQSSVTSTDSISYREKFVAPEMTLWDMFLSKPLMSYTGSEDADFESDSDKESESDFSDDDDVDGYRTSKNTAKVADELSPHSYSWHILRLAIIRVVLDNIKAFFPMTGLEVSELGISSPLINNILQLLGQWQVSLAKDLEAFVNPPDDFIKGINNISTPLQGRPAILKHQAVLESSNTPFSGTSVDSLGARRLWHCLIHKENIQDMFIRYIFHNKPTKQNVDSEHENEDRKHFTPVHNRSHDKTGNKKLGARRATIAVMSSVIEKNHHQLFEEARSGRSVSDKHIGKVKILHKETEIVSSFCINNANPTCIVLSTRRDVQEVDVSTLLTCDTWSWIEEDVSPNVLQEDGSKSGYQKEEEFLVVSRRQSMFSTPPSTPTSYAAMAAAASGMTEPLQTGQDLTGHHDGSIRMWEWGHPQQITLFRPPGQYPKVTNLHFSSLGNKICAVDADGYLALWQVSSPRKPFLYHQSHDRAAADCCFLSSTSVVATTGISSSHRNVAIWDTLLPPRSMLVKDFNVHEGVGGACVTYSSQTRCLLVGGRDGKVSIFDMRKDDTPLTSFTAHEAPVKCISIGRDDKLFVTGSVVGDVRVWDCNSHSLVYNLAGEHSRTSLFRNFGSGTMKVEISTRGNRLFSCGADGTLKLRVLPNDPNQNGVGHSFANHFEKVALQKQVMKLAQAIRHQCLAY